MTLINPQYHRKPAVFAHGDMTIPAVQLAGSDAFGRAMVGEPATVFDSVLRYDLQPLLWETVTIAGGQVFHVPEESSALLSVTPAPGDRVIRQSRRWCTYQPGKGHTVFITGTLGAPAAGRVALMGYGDEANGVFLQLREQGLGILFRSSVSGSLVEQWVPQADWNCDPLDGSPRSLARNVLDPAKSQILVIDLQWLGVGRVRVGFDLDGDYICAHEFLNDNRNVSTYWTTATLPVRYELHNSGASVSAGTMRQICCSVQSNGGLDLGKGFSFGAANSASVAVTTRRPVLSIRPLPSFKGIVNRMSIAPVDLDAMAANNAALLELVYDGTLTGASWASADAESGTEYDQTASAISGGVVIWRGLLPTAGGSKPQVSADGRFPSLLYLTNSIDGTITTPLTLVATSLSGTSNINAAIRWTEIR